MQKTYLNSFLSVFQLGRDTLLNKTGKRISVGQFRISIMLYSSIVGALGLFLAGFVTLFRGLNNESILFLSVTGAILTALGVIVYILLRIKRLHDINQSGWKILLLLIPLINIYFLLKYGFQKSDKETNKYGNNPLNFQPNENKNYRLVFFVLLVIVVAIELAGPIVYTIG